MNQTLRPYQRAAIDAVFDGFDMGYTRLLYTMATGLGKTTTFAELCKIFLECHEYKVLILAHRKELITQAYHRIKDHCGLDEFQIGCEIAQDKAPRSAQVVVGSVFTVVGEHRLPDFIPNVIITDEAHRAAATTYTKIYERFGVHEGKCLHIGCTATAKRTDRQSLYAVRPDGTRVQVVDKKTKRKRDVEKEECVFEYHCYDFGIAEGVEEGFLVPVVGHTVQTDTDLSDVETDTDGDFKEGQLAKAVDNALRTNQAISAWKEIAEDRPTIAFCASVEHAYHAADLWRQAGYTAEALDGNKQTTSDIRRFEVLNDFRAGNINVLCNVGLFTEGMDAPKCAAIVHLRPTKSWNLFVQMTGRGTRVLPGVVDGLIDPEERRKAIQSSEKRDCVVIDLVDLCGKHELCTVPSILDLPAQLDLQGHSVTDAKKLLEEFEEVRERVIGECPLTYQDLQVRLAQVDMLRKSAARSQQDWKATEKGFRYSRMPVGYTAEINPVQGGGYELIVKHHTRGEVLKKHGKPGGEFKAYLDHAQRWINHAVEADKANEPAKSRNTLQRLSPGQTRCLRANGHRDADIDCMPYAKAKALIDKYMTAWMEKKRVVEEANS